MRKFLLATSCLALSPMAAMAQPPAPVFSWAGFYVGANVGGGMMTSPFGTANVDGSGTSLAGVLSSSTTGLNGVGALAGGQFGYNYQQGNWVFGVEGEGFWSGMKLKSTETSFNPDGSVLGTGGSTVSNTGDFTLAGRLGIAFDRTMIYGKGGWAWGSHDFTTFANCCSPNFASSSSRNASGTLDGPLVGVGVEHALTRNWTVKFEYDYINFGFKELRGTACISSGCFPLTSSNSFSSSKQIFKVGANYLFDIGKAP